MILLDRGIGGWVGVGVNTAKISRQVAGRRDGDLRYVGKVIARCVATLLLI